MGNVSKNNVTRLFTLNELSLRLSPALADEIGLNESIILLQLEYWIHISNHFIEGQRWTYQSVRQMQEKAFSFWSVATISRTVNSLLDKGLIIEGKYNKKSYDNTRWFALNYKELSKLKSIMIRGYDMEGSETPLFQNETPLLQDETPPLQNETPLFQNETTIPQITPQTTPQITPQNTIAAAAADCVYAREDDPCVMGRHKPVEVSDSLPDVEDEGMGLKAIDFAELNLKRELSNYERSELIHWCKKFKALSDCHDPESIVIAGLKRCVIKNDLSSLIAYLEPILEDLLKNNIIRLE
ncbi:DnaD domain protein [Desulfosporosinus sp. OT]|uniref:DnaD domain-containing protein n=1 Tax=Desulfosporosinus sp. OT TaxID=913865 RepID=UPI0002239CE8|nr:DnaD domain protein [Desulfosporosinus sp. OT]EGW39347.1 hypothetical protein DOT_2632 [Desulfosporosinus sp. OT]